MDLKGKKICFVDFDGVLTSQHETPGSYVTHISDYGMSISCYDRLEEICIRTGALVVITSNWRRFDDDGKWSYCTFDGVHSFKNPLPILRKELGKRYIGDLPKNRHINKTQALILWFEQHPEFNGEFVILDDDPREGFQLTNDYGISKHFILTNAEWGLTNENIERAVEILCPERFKL